MCNHPSFFWDSPSHEANNYLRDITIAVSQGGVLCALNKEDKLTPHAQADEVIDPSGKPGQILKLYPSGTTIHFTTMAIYRDTINMSRESTTLLEDF
jgi:hypothetical protein